MDTKYNGVYNIYDEGIWDSGEEKHVQDVAPSLFHCSDLPLYIWNMLPLGQKI